MPHSWIKSYKENGCVKIDRKQGGLYTIEVNQLKRK